MRKNDDRSSPRRVRLVAHLSLSAATLLARQAQPYRHVGIRSPERRALEATRRLWRLDRHYYASLPGSARLVRAELRQAREQISLAERLAIFATSVWVANADGVEVGPELDALARVREALAIPWRQARAIHSFVRNARRSLRRPPSMNELEALVLAIRRGASDPRASPMLWVHR
ncbi:MAG: hypothetical protein KC416_00710 [Myxococcales bacterium]|nr:hypothetical protein [Myxococcales bacterium]